MKQKSLNHDAILLDSCDLNARFHIFAAGGREQEGWHCLRSLFPLFLHCWLAQQVQKIAEKQYGAK